MRQRKFYTPITLYKFANKKSNGHYAFTGRGGWVIYGNTARRMEKLTKQRFLTGLAFVPGSGVCQHFFDHESCAFWSYLKSDEFGVKKRQELGRFPYEERNKLLIQLSMKKAMENPFQYGLLTAMEGSKMFFWEHTRAGLVAYPGWLERLFDFLPFTLTINSLLAILSFLSLIYLIYFLWRKKKGLFDLTKIQDESTTILLPILILMTAYIGLHSLFLIVPRYTYPIVPLYLILIAFFFQQILGTKKPS